MSKLIDPHYPAGCVNNSCGVFSDDSLSLSQQGTDFEWIFGGLQPKTSSYPPSFLSSLLANSFCERSCDGGLRNHQPEMCSRHVSLRYSQERREKHTEPLTHDRNALYRSLADAMRDSASSKLLVPSGVLKKIRYCFAIPFRILVLRGFSIPFFIKRQIVKTKTDYGNCYFYTFHSTPISKSDTKADDDEKRSKLFPEKKDIFHFFFRHFFPFTKFRSPRIFIVLTHRNVIQQRIALLANKINLTLKKTQKNWWLKLKNHRNLNKILSFQLFI